MRRDSLRRLTIVMLVAMSPGCTAQTAMGSAYTAVTSGNGQTRLHDEVPPIVTDFSTLVRENGAAVVNIRTTARHPASNFKQIWPPAGSEDDPFFGLFQQFSDEFPGAARAASQSPGSGFIVNPGGYILTDSKLIADATQITVTLQDGREYRATVAGNDPASGIALLKIPVTGLPAVTIGSVSGEKAGNWVASIGNPYGLSNTVTAGIISSMSRELPQVSYIPLIQTDMTGNAGDAGSPVFSLNGKVIGIEEPATEVAGNVEGLAFAIPIDEAMKVEQQLQQYHKAQHGRLGITIQDVSGPLAQSFGLAKPEGALVSSVEPDGPSATSGLRPGDVILQMNGVALSSSEQLPVAVADLKPGSRVRLTYWRENATHDATVILGRLNDATSESAAFAQATVPDGLTVRGLTPDEQREAGVKGGVRVEKSVGPAAFAGIEPGDVILMVNNSPVSNPTQFRQKIQKSGNAVALLVQRDGQRMFVTLEIG